AVHRSASASRCTASGTRVSSGLQSHGFQHDLIWTNIDPVGAQIRMRGYEARKHPMKRSLTALVLAGSLATATIAMPTDAEARRLRGWGVGAFAIGALVGAALARPYYARSYYSYPGYYGYAYPAYSYGYAYPAYGYYSAPTG